MCYKKNAGQHNMSTLWEAQFNMYGAEIRPFIEVQKWLQSNEWAATFIYKRVCIMKVYKKERLPGVWDIVIHHIMAKEQRMGHGTRAVLALTIEASKVGWGVRVEYLMNEASRGLSRRLIRSYGFTFTPRNEDVIYLLFERYMDPSTVYSPIDVKEYLPRYYEAVGIRLEEPPSKRRRKYYTF